MKTLINYVLGTPILPEDISTFYSLNFPNLSAVSATDCNIQVHIIYTNIIILVNKFTAILKRIRFNYFISYRNEHPV